MQLMISAPRADLGTRRAGEPRSLWGLPLAMLIVVQIASVSPGWASDCTLKSFGGRNRFAPTPASDLSSLSRNMRSLEGDLRHALGDAGWEGQLADILDALDTAEQKPFPVGQHFEWMVLRRNGKPSVIRHVCWGGERPFQGWELKVVSAGHRWTFAIPVACTNLALLRSEPLPAPPQEPEATPEPAKLGCDLELSHTSVMASEEISVSVTASAGTEGVLLVVSKDGARIIEEDLEAPYRWTGSLDEPGEYTVKATVSGPGMVEEECHGSLEVTAPPHARWIIRGFGAFADASFGHGWTRLEGTMHHGEHFGADNAWGAGFSVEFLPSPRIGIEGGLTWLRQEATLMADWDELWEMGDDDLDWLIVSLGTNFRLTPPGSRVDLFAGPLLAYVDPGETEFLVFGQKRTISLDKEVTWGAQLGMDVPACAGGCPAFHAAVRYLDLSTDGGGFEVDPSPLVFQAGIAFRF